MKQIQILMLCIMGLNASELATTTVKKVVYVRPSITSQPSNKKPVAVQMQVSH